MTIDLSLLAAPVSVETIDFETIFEALKADFLDRWATARLQDSSLPAIDVLLDSSPISMAFRVAAYREVLIRARVNDAVKQMLLAYATGANLDHLGAYLGVERLTDETDTRYRKRIQLRPEALSVAGPAGAYVYHAMTAVPDLIDVTAIRSDDGQVTVTLLADVDDPSPTDEQISTVLTALEETDVVPLTDTIIVQGPTVSNVAISVELTLYPGPDGAIVKVAAETALAKLKAANAQLNQDLTLSAIYSRAHQDGVQSVRIVSPAADVAVSETGFVRISSITVTVAGRNT